MLLLGGPAARRPGLEAASRVAQATGARLLCETFPARLERGAGIPGIDRLAYLAEFAAEQLAGARHLILAGAAAPVSFFAYPGKASSLIPAGAEVHVLAEPADDVCGALGRLADLAAPGTKPLAREAERPELPPTGDLTGADVGGGRRRAAARGRDRRPTRPTRPGCGCPGPPRARRRTTG